MEGKNFHERNEKKYAYSLRQKDFSRQWSWSWDQLDYWPTWNYTHKDNKRKREELQSDQQGSAEGQNFLKEGRLGKDWRHFSLFFPNSN